jgi:hypothetical protein
MSIMPEASTYSRFADFVAKEVINRASGRVFPGPPDVVNGSLLRRPADIFFVGSLGPDAAFGNFNTAPSAMGVEFFTRDLGEIRVRGSFDYYRAERPTFAMSQSEAEETNDASFQLPVPLRSYSVDYAVDITLCEGFQQWPIEIDDEARATSYGAPRQAANYILQKSSLASEEQFDAAIRAVDWTLPELTFGASVTIDVTQDALRGFRVQIRIVNQSANTRWVSAPRTMRRVDRFEEPFFFNVDLLVDLKSNVIEPTILELDAADFRYDNRLWADGFNAAAEFEPRSNSIRTRYAPVARQRRVRHLVGTEDLEFGRFADEPLSRIKRLESEMVAFRETWQPSSHDDPSVRAAEDADRDRFADEARRFSQGIVALESDERAMRAFVATMRAFANMWNVRAPGRSASWRRFQMVFIVCVIGGLFRRILGDYEDLKIVDVLWFPTGGGKTEAYLALMIWQAFFDRLTGKKVGVTAMMRFPLRLLSLQQMQRVVEAIACAEQIRKASKDFAGDPFSVGFLVGSTATRNKLSPSDIQQLQEQLKLPFANRQDWVKRQRVIVECPSCHRRSVDIRIDTGDRLTHFCTDKSCNAVLPLIVIDDEVYRFLPTVLVGTIDKLALIGHNIRWRQLLGFVDTLCSLHGYHAGGKCQVYQCSGVSRPVKLTNAGPALEIQDELHLLREDVGVVASHYETVAHAIVEKYNKIPMKVVASTATIQDHERHVRALYCRESRQFPAAGPELGRSFYVDTQEFEQRLFIGVMPRRLTHINALMQLMQIEHTLLQKLRTRQIDQAIVTDDELDAVLDYYEVVVTYTLRRIDQDRVDGSIASQLNPYLSRRQLRTVQNQPMTANTTTEEVTAILDGLEHPASDVQQRVTSLTATSMISHGVDVDRLNVMNFFGMPFSTAEYIQSSSRVGRFVAGCVFIVYQAHKERERSHYQRFLKYHEFQNRLVEPVPLNRWATRGLHFTSPGLVMAAIFALFGDRWTGPNRKSLWIAKEVLKAFDTRVMSIEETATALVDALHADPADRQMVQEQLEYLIRDGLEQARVADGKKGFGACMAPEPMMSLRDVEESFNVDVLGPNMWFVEAL